MLVEVRTRGRANREVDWDVVGEVGEEDLRRLASVEKGTTAPAVQKLRSRHHSLARLLASGLPHGEAAIMSGYSVSRVSILLGDPTFRELVTFYQNSADEVYKDMHTSLAALAQDAVEELRDRLEEDPEKVSTNSLVEIAKTGADRTGFGPKTTQVNVHVGVADRLRAAREKRAVIDVEATDG